jgi:hypothetical protein
MMKSMTRFVLGFVAALLAAAPAPSFAQDYAAIIACADRADADRRPTSAAIR